MRRTEKGMEVSPNHSPTDNRTKNKDKSPISERSASEVADSSSASTTTPTTPTTKDAGSKRRTREFLLQSQAAMLVPEEDPDKDYNSNNHRRIRLQQPQQDEERSGAEDLLLGESGGCSPRSPPLPLRNPLITRSKSPRSPEDESGDSFDLLQVETEDEDGMGDEDADESTDSSDLGNSGSSMPVSPSVSSNFMAMSTENLVGYSRYWRRKRLEEVCWKDAVEQTCNLGQASFPPDTEMNFLNRLLGKVLHPQKPNWLSEFLKYMLVTPLTNITPMSLYYQLYLNEIFHTNFISRGIHFLMMPCVTWTYLLIAAHWEVQILNDPPPRPAYHIDGKPVDLFAINGAFFLSLLFLIWWIVWGFVTKTYGFGFFMIPNLLVLYNTANIFHYWTKYDDSIATWWAPSPWYVNPWLLGIVFATIQALSHLAEPLPPRMNLTDRWVPKLEFLKEHWPNNKVYVIMVWLPQFIFGPINEFLAGPRLLPLLILKQMHMLGYRRDQWKHLVRLTKWARRYENPALDYIGTGGGLPMAKAEHVPPESYSAAKSELRILKGRTNEKDVDRRMFLKMLLAKAQLNLWAYGPFASSSSSSSSCDDEGGEEVKKKEGSSVKMSSSYLEHCKQSDWEYDFKACIRLVRRDVIKIERVRQRILDDQRRKALQLVEAEKVSTPSLGSSTSTMPLASSSSMMLNKQVAKVTDSPALGSSPSLVRRGRDFLQRSFSLS